MPRPPRIEYPDAIYHVTSRGAIFVDDVDRARLLSILNRTLKGCKARAFAYCLMGNHYHFVLQTHLANLSVLMHRLNSVYSLTFNQRHGRRGSAFEGRFKALHVDRDGYLLEACRYVELNPVRAGLVESAGQWNWSSYRAHAGFAPPPSWLATSDLHALLMGRAPTDERHCAVASQRYADFVAEGKGVRLWQESLREGLYLGDEAFVERVKGHT